MGNTDFANRGDLLRHVSKVLFQTTNDGILVADQTGLIVECNQAAGEMFGYPNGSLRGGRIDQLLPASLRKAHAQHHGEYHAHPKSRSMGDRTELSAVRQDGSEFFVDISLTPIKLSDQTLVCAQVRDVSWRVEQEQRLQASLVELNRFKQFAEAENINLREELKGHHSFEEIVGQSPKLLEVLNLLEMVAPTATTVLITGETGTGKELMARAIHTHSDRSEKPFLSVNCASLPEGLVESELFGHEKGAFTGATSQRLGRFEQSDGGTLFLDEIGEMPLAAQAKVLRVLQDGVFERVGSTKARHTDVRVVAATNRDLAADVHEGRFRGDLYHRLSVFPLHLPPLCERREDIPLLTTYLTGLKAQRLGRIIERIPQGVMDRLIAYSWPGNVRELGNVIERAIILSPGPELREDSIQLGPTPTASHAPPHTSDTHGMARPHSAATGNTSLIDHERGHIRQVCEDCGWKIKGPGGAAEKLGLNPSTLYSRMKKLGIKKSVK
jgi:formate hydrogenlyase transcriptional activator